MAAPTTDGDPEGHGGGGGVEDEWPNTGSHGSVGMGVQGGEFWEPFGEQSALDETRPIKTRQSFSETNEGPQSQRVRMEGNRHIGGHKHWYTLKLHIRTIKNTNGQNKNQIAPRQI